MDRKVKRSERLWAVRQKVMEENEIKTSDNIK